MKHSSSSHGHAVAVDRVLLTQALRSCHVSASIEASRHARIPSLSTESLVLVLWLNQVTRRFSGEPPQTPRADSGCEPLPCTGSGRRLRLAFLATMRPALDPAGHRVPQVRPTCLSTCTNTNQAATCTCNTRPRVSPHHVVNHSSQLGVTIHRSSDALVLRFHQQKSLVKAKLATRKS
jgi:hypothetical protein